MPDLVFSQRIPTAKRRAMTCVLGLVVIGHFVLGADRLAAALPEGPKDVPTTADVPATYQPVDSAFVAEVSGNRTGGPVSEGPGSEGPVSDGSASDGSGSDNALADGTLADGPGEDEPPISLGPTNALPAALLQLPSNTAGALVADLTENRLYLYRQHDGEITLAETLYVTIGKNGANKQVEGDERTPVGVYFVTRHIADQRLPELYGVGAFPVNYPNLWDRRRGRTGSGIWIHGMPRDQETRPARSSRGCLALKNNDFVTISESVTIKQTPVLISERITWRTPAANEARRQDVQAAVEGWRQAWESLDTDRYLAYYADDFRFGRMNRAAWARHKQRVNAHKRYIRIGLEAIGVYEYPGESDLVLVDFLQSYNSSNFNGQSQKRQFWQRQADGTWRIVHEGTATLD